MAAAITIIQVIGTVIGVGATVLQTVQQRRAQGELRKRNEVSNRIAANQRARSIRRAVAEARIRRGTTEAAGLVLVSQVVVQWQVP